MKHEAAWIVHKPYNLLSFYQHTFKSKSAFEYGRHHRAKLDSGDYIFVRWENIRTLEIILHGSEPTDGCTFLISYTRP